MKLDSREAGVTLIELLVTLVILGIIVGIGVPMYRQYIQRAHRVDATTALLRLSANQERFYLQNNSYAGNGQIANAMPDGLGIGSTENGYYTLSITPAAGGLTVGYTASASVIVGGAQGSDKECWDFSINEQGTRSAENFDGDDNTAKCWE